MHTVAPDLGSGDHQTTRRASHIQSHAMSGPDMKNKILLVLGISGLVIVLMATIGITWILIENPTLDVRLRCPESVFVGETFDLVLVTKNLHSESIRLDSIDVDLDFLSGFDVVSITPPPVDHMDIMGYRSWDFGESVLPGETLNVTFTLTALKQGHYVGDVDVCNPNQDFTTVIPNMDVLAK